MRPPVRPKRHTPRSSLGGGYTKLGGPTEPIEGTSPESQRCHTDRATACSQQTEQVAQDRQAAGVAAQPNELQSRQDLLDSRSSLIDLRLCMAQPVAGD